MNYSKFHLYTVAQGERFIKAARRCAISFVTKNPGMKFTIFQFEDKKTFTSKEKNITTVSLLPSDYFTFKLSKKSLMQIFYFSNSQMLLYFLKEKKNILD